MRLIAFFAQTSVSLVQFFLNLTPTKKKQWIASVIILGSIFFFPSFFYWVNFKSVRNLKHYIPPTPSKLLDRKGRLISTFFTDNRIVINSKELPPYVAQAFIAIEDNRFYEHHGIDFQGIFRAALKNLIYTDTRQGGSTITQQVIKVILTNRERSYTRKIREAFLSLYLDQLFTKQEILNLYFNEIYFGHGNYGLEAASNFYFSKSARDLTIGEAAILASLPSAPNKYSPVRNPHLSRLRSTQVLYHMIDMNFITRAQAVKVFDELTEYYSNLNLSPDSTAFGQRVDKAPYFTEYMRGILEDKLGKARLYGKGLSIYTSLDLDHQLVAQKALWNGLKSQAEKGYDHIFTHQLDFSTQYSDSIEMIKDLAGLPDFQIQKTRAEYEFQLAFYKDHGDDLEILNHATGSSEVLADFYNDIRDSNPYLPHITPPEGALIEIDQKTGEITAMVGGRPFSAVNQINRTMNMKRQPGSTFKPILYATAIDMKKITAASEFLDAPTIHPDAAGEYWIPENSSGGFRGFVTIREGLVNSINMISIGIAREIGLKNALPKIAEILHVNTKDIPNNLTVALGSYEVSPFQMARAFSLFPRGGKDITPFVISKIVDDRQKIVYLHKEDPDPPQILDPGTTTIMTELLQNVVDSGTGKAVRSVGYKGFAAGKTGTSSHFRDAWFVGFNDRYTTAVWVGYDKPSQSLGEGQYGGSVAAPIWGYFQFYTQPYRHKDEPMLVHDGVTEVEICKATGKLPGSDCTETITEYFLPDTEPIDTEEETVHQKIKGTTGLGKTKSTDHLEKENLMEDIYQ